MQAAVSDSSPSIADAQRLLVERISEQSAGRMHLVNFISPSGPHPAPWDNDGEKRFLVTYEAELEFSQACVWDCRFQDQPVTFKIFEPGEREPVPNRVFSISKGGERYSIQGQMAVKGTGTGWLATAFTLSDPPKPLRPAATPSSFPADVLENSILKLRFYLPDPEHGYYRGTRFDWSGLISRVEYAGHSFFSEFKQEHDPLNHDDTCGTSEEFGINAPAGYAQAHVGETFLKPGIGLLVKPEEQNYSFFNRYKIAELGSWKISKEPNSVEFRQDFTGSNGWSYTYTKRLEIDPKAAVLTIHRMLKNTGTKLIDTDHYGHNFLKIDDWPAGPDYVIVFQFVPRFGEGSRPRDYVEIRNRSLMFLKEIPSGDSVWVRIEGFSSIEDNRITLRNKRTGAAMEIATDQPATRMAFFSQGGALSPEPFVAVNVPPGSTKEWKTKYTFSTGTVR